MQPGDVNNHQTSTPEWVELTNGETSPVLWTPSHKERADGRSAAGKMFFVKRENVLRRSKTLITYGKRSATGGCEQPPNLNPGVGWTNKWKDLSLPLDTLSQGEGWWKECCGKMFFVKRENVLRRSKTLITHGKRSATGGCEQHQTSTPEWVELTNGKTSPVLWTPSRKERTDGRDDVGWKRAFWFLYQRTKKRLFYYRFASDKERLRNFCVTSGVKLKTRAFESIILHGKLQS